MATPQWSAQHNGILGDASAMENATDLNQFLGTHAQQVIYAGTLIVSPTQYTSGPGSPYNVALGSTDFDQPFTMSGTSIGRVQIPVLPVGNGADLLVSLCSDNAGAPGTLITQTRIPAAWIYQLAPVVGTASGDPTTTTTTYTNNPLATSTFSLMEIGNFQQVTYPTPAVTGISAASSSAFYTPYIVQVGGVNGGAALNTVFTIPYGPGGTLGKSIPQTNFPVNNDGSSATIVSVDPSSGDAVAVNCGGGTSLGGASVASVYTSNLDTSTGSLSAWSAQTALPYAVQNHTMAAYGGYVYVIGGKLNSSTGYANVTYAQVQNGQITGWTATTPLPAARSLALTAVSNGFLFVVGGQDAGITTQYTNVWYSPIHADGSLGNWIAGPSLPNADINLNDNAFANAYGLICGGASHISCLPVTVAGPGLQWTQSADISGNYPGFFDAGGGLVSSGSQFNGQQWTYDTFLMGYVSVPLPASGLTNGTTYHVLMQQQGGDLNDNLILPLSHGVGISGQTSPRSAYTWTAWPNDGTHLVGSALGVFNNSAPPPGTQALHLWDDHGTRISTFVSNTTPDRSLIGICEATAMTTAQNANTGFETSLAPWNVTGGAMARSNTQAFEGQYSCQITPTGSATNVYITSELIPCLPGQTITAACQAWFTNSVTSNFSMSVNWYTSGRVLISTTAALVSASAATWTPVTQQLTAVSAPSFAYYYSLQPTLSGTPAAGQVWYVDNLIGYATYLGSQLPGVAQITYTGTQYPSINPLKATGTVVLA